MAGCGGVQEEGRHGDGAVAEILHLIYKQEAERVSLGLPGMSL